MKTCPVCQKALTDQAKFCYYCGASLLNAEPAPAPEVEPEPEPAEESLPIETPEVPSLSEEPVTKPVETPEPAPVEELEPVAEPEPLPEPEPAPAPVYEPEPVFVPKPAPEPRPVFTPEPKPVVKEEPKKDTIVLATDSRSLMTTAGYIFTTILFHIPIIGLIFMIVWGCGKTKNISRKRFSLAFLIMRLICYILTLACAVFLLICFSEVFPKLWGAVKPILFP